jgi:hypothetical protein
MEDSCGVCSGGNSGHEADSDIDCAGVCDGDWVVDDCDDCVDPDDYNGAQDCAGVCDGDAMLDECEVCDDDPSNDCVDYTIALDGIDLISFHALPENDSIKIVFSGIEGSNPGIFSEEESAMFDNEFGWIGGLTKIDRQDGYWVVIDGEADLDVVDALPTDPETTVYSLHEGANLISYPFSGCAPVEETIPEEAHSSIEGIITEGRSAFNRENDWLGGLVNFCGTAGYWLITNDSVSFTYNPPAEGVARKASPIRSVPMEFAFKQSTQQAFYFVENATIGGEPIEKEDLIIAYNGDVRVGSRYWYGETTDVPAMGTDGSDAYAGYCNAGDKLSFKVLDASSGDLIDMVADGEAIWNNNEFSIISLSDRVIPEEISFGSVYPNPFNPVTMISFAVPSEMEVHVAIHDMLGRVVAELTDGIYRQGNYELQWNASQQSSGIYFVKMVAGGQTNIQKLMLVK